MMNEEQHCCCTEGVNAVEVHKLMNLLCMPLSSAFLVFLL